MSSPTELRSRSGGGDRSRGAPMAAGTLDDRLFVVCALFWSTGLIHAVAALQHVDEYLLYAVFFGLLAPLQFAWGIILCKRPTRKRVLIGAAASLLVAGLWVISRTSGLPIGPTPWTPESIGASDAIATANEITLALLALDWYRSQSGHGLPRTLSRLLTGLGVLLAALSALAVIASGHGS